MRAKEIMFDNLIECPVKGCKRGFYTSIPMYGHYICPEHQTFMNNVFRDKKGTKYMEVIKFDALREEQL